MERLRCGMSQRWDQRLERDHEHAALPAPNASRSDDAQNRHGAKAAPSSALSPQPRSLFVHHGQVAFVIGARLRLDRERDSTWCDRHEVDVARSPPIQRVAHTPALRPQRRERPTDLVLGPRADTAASRKPKPTPGVQPKCNCSDSEDTRDRNRSSASEREGHPSRSSRRGDSCARLRQPTILLAPRVVHLAPVFEYATAWRHVDGDGPRLRRPASKSLGHPQMGPRQRMRVENGAIGKVRPQLHTPAGPTTTSEIRTRLGSPPLAPRMKLGTD
jgi:hypothetical protein